MAKPTSFKTLCAEGVEPAEIQICMPVPNIPNCPTSWEGAVREAYCREGDALAEFLLRHLPGGLVDALFASLARRKANLFSVPYSDLPGEQP